MIKKLIRKVFLIATNKEDQVVKPADRIKELSKRTAPKATFDSWQHASSLDEKMDRGLEMINLARNGITVKTGEFEAITRLFTGQKMYVDTRDVSETPHLVLDGRREENVTIAFQRIWKSHFVLFDVGANFGYFPLLAGMEIDKKGTQLHLFEPNPDLVPLLEKTMSVNGLTSCSKIVPKAVGDKNGDITLHRIKNLWGGATTLGLDKLKQYRPVEDEFDAHFEVELISLDSYCADNKIDQVDVVKIDVEGFEDSVYKGMKDTIRRNPGLILLLEFTFGAYDNAPAFFKKITRDFTYVYGVDGYGDLILLPSYKAALNVAQSEWLMVVASNKVL